ncbi:tetratricopeptide repeat protein [Streptomyces sp. NRRL S-340]|uniref:tetratricopeptide repeat protein n=1 Tax=Streptomyces sp. NRRL S-340 TaxID=1463901 RepID=UPI0006916DE7|nr:tetratricopeptide repeat protein [Streptomyces sp. NRRL S-340]
MDTKYYDHGAPAERWDRARMFFDARDYAGAARVLNGLVEEVPEQTGPRLLLARAYYHSAQLRRAEAELRVIVERDPVEHYARLMLGRTLQRQGRHEEAATHLRLASALAGEFAGSADEADGEVSGG